MPPLRADAIEYFNKSKITSAAEVEVFVMLTVPQSAHPKEKHTTNKGDVKTKSIYYNRNKSPQELEPVARKRRHLRAVDLTEWDLSSSSQQPFKTDRPLRALRKNTIRTLTIKKPEEQCCLAK